MTNNTELFTKAKQLMPGGVSSPVRAFKSVGGTPRFIKSGQGSAIYDEEGHRYIDFIGSWGPLILGHAHPKIVKAIQETAARGTSFGAPTAKETMLAQDIVDFVPSIEKVRFVNSGTEATMSALRLARGFTGRKEIVKFAGCYHGHSDGLLIKAGSGATTLGVPDSAGVPAEITQLTVPAVFNDPEGLETIFKQRGESIAAVIIEPVAGNMGVIPPAPGFLEKTRDLCSHYGSLLIFDEVMSGFRVDRGGAQELYGVTPDLTCLGKIIGGGLPVGAYGGKNEIMEFVAPAGPVYQAGTLSGNPLAITAGHETLKIINTPGFYEKLEQKILLFDQALLPEIKKHKWKLCFQRVGSMATLFFRAGPVNTYTDALQADTTLFKKFHQYLLKEGIYFPPSQFEAFFISAAHTTAEIEKTIEILLDYCYKNY
ncbi:glutamate-1-semialdehyde 2,1-aminomutase [candidate division CSSED10-310 bacterium]|uniref:Glutamate-1-semialdehyde 2,1-aminomutase n=1 Tax=candidate division CSSED10-310 bacterium TaxID=2855610 RepID=A0ABV6YVB7_UNCC1